MSEQPEFSASMSLDQLDLSDQELLQRRLSTYSVDSLRAAKKIDQIWVQHAGFTRALKVMDRLFQLGPELDMPQGARFIGPTGVGKTSLIKYFKQSLPKSSLFSEGVGVISLRVPQKPKTGHFVAGILRAIEYPFATGSGKQLYQRRTLVMEALRSMGTRLIWLDEAHHLIHQPRGTALKDWENESTEFLRELMDVCRVSLILAGTSDLDNLDDAASHLASRITIREALKDFEPDVNWVGFLRAFAREASTFDISYINEPVMARRLHMATRGNIRALKRLVTETVLLASDGGRLKLDGDLFSTAFYLVNGQATKWGNPFVA